MALWVLLAAVTVAVLASCREGTVRLSFRPAAGERSAYRITVRATTVTTVGDEPPRRRVTDTVFVADQRVLDLTAAGGRVEVRLQEQGGPARTFVVRLDRAGEVAEVQSIEGLPARALGELGLSEIFPPAAAAPPDRPLAPGQRWTIDTAVRLAGPSPSRLRGTGRLVALGRVDGLDVARVESRFRLPVRSSGSPSADGLSLDGSQTTATAVTYSIDDGTVMSARARTRGSFDITLFPPVGTPGSPAPGTLEVDVTSRTERLDR